MVSWKPISSCYMLTSGTIKLRGLLSNIFLYKPDINYHHCWTWTAISWASWHLQGSLVFQEATLPSHWNLFFVYYSNCLKNTLGNIPTLSSRHVKRITRGIFVKINVLYSKDPQKDELSDNSDLVFNYDSGFQQLRKQDTEDQIIIVPFFISQQCSCFVSWTQLPKSPSTLSSSVACFVQIEPRQSKIFDVQVEVWELKSSKISLIFLPNKDFPTLIQSKCLQRARNVS